MAEVKLSELPIGETIDIGGFDFIFKGYEKRKTNFGNQQFFVFKCKKPEQEKIFERFKFSTTKIKLNNGKYKW